MKVVDEKKYFTNARLYVLDIPTHLYYHLDMFQLK